MEKKTDEAEGGRLAAPSPSSRITLPCEKIQVPDSTAAGRPCRARRDLFAALKTGRELIHLRRRPLPDPPAHLDRLGDFPRICPELLGLVRVVLQTGLAVGGD